MAHEAVADVMVDVPVEVVYRAWSDFEHYPRFMPHIKRVRRTDASGRRLHWESRAKARPHQWDAEVTDLTTNQRVAWRSLSGRANDGAVLLEPQGEHTRVTLRWNYEPLAQGNGHWASVVADDMTQAVREDLLNFKRLVETGQPPRVRQLPVWVSVGIVPAVALAALGLGAWYVRMRGRVPSPRAAWRMRWLRGTRARHRRWGAPRRWLTRTTRRVGQALALALAR